MLLLHHEASGEAMKTIQNSLKRLPGLNVFFAMNHRLAWLQFYVKGEHRRYGGVFLFKGHPSVGCGHLQKSGHFTHFVRGLHLYRPTIFCDRMSGARNKRRPTGICTKKHAGNLPANEFRGSHHLPAPNQSIRVHLCPSVVLITNRCQYVSRAF